jgi:uncharacterized repeat protein (TIGR03803 family)
VLYAFCSQPSCADRSLPLAGVIVANGAFYGTTRNGGNGQGVVFKVTPNGESTLYRFCPQAPCVDGAYPYAGVIEVDGSLYGATAGGGTAPSSSCPSDLWRQLAVNNLRSQRQGFVGCHLSASPLTRGNRGQIKPP